MPIHRNTTVNRFADPGSAAVAAHFAGDKEVLSRRVTRMASGWAWTEDAPSIQRHLMSNVQDRAVDGALIPARGSFEV